MRTDVFLAVRFLADSRTQTLLLVSGITVGIAVLFFLTALVTAVERTMLAQTVDAIPHASLRPPEESARPLEPERASGVFAHQVHTPAQRDKSIDAWPSLVVEIERSPGVSAVSPSVIGSGTISRGVSARAITFMGVDADRFSRVVAISPRMRQGEFRPFGGGIAIGIDLADDLGARVGGRVVLGAPGGDSHSFEVTGTFDLGNVESNGRLAIVDLGAAQMLLGRPGSVTLIDVRVSDMWGADDVAHRLGARTQLTADSWIAGNTQLVTAIQSQRGATMMVRVCMMVAVALAIASVLIVSVLQRSRQIGILRAMGASSRVVLTVFVLQGVFVSAGGALAGVVVGTALSLWSEAANIAADGTPMYPITLPPSLYALSAGVSLLTGLVAAAVPAFRASRLDPAVAIRHD